MVHASDVGINDAAWAALGMHEEPARPRDDGGREQEHIQVACEDAAESLNMVGKFVVGEELVTAIATVEFS